MKMSSPMASGCMAAMASTSSAVRLRGHGHWPTVFRLASSMATMTMAVPRSGSATTSPAMSATKAANGIITAAVPTRSRRDPSQNAR